MDKTSAPFYTVAAVALLILAYTMWRLWPTGDPVRDAAHRELRWPALTLLSINVVIQFSAAPATIGLLNQITHVPNFAALWVYGLLDALACSAFVLIAYWREPAEVARRSSRKWILGYGLVIGALIVLFIVGRPGVEHRVDFDTAFARTPAVATFIVLYLVAYGWGAVAVAVVTWRWSRQEAADVPWLRRGLRFLAAGALLGVAFALAKLTAVFARMTTNTDLDVLSSNVAPGLAFVGTVLFATGFALPAAGHRMTRLRARLHRWRDYRALYPLWSALATFTPGLAATAKKLPRFDLEVRAVARTSIISDAEIELRQYMDPAVTRRAQEMANGAGLSGTERDAVIAAIQLRCALIAREQGRRFPMQDHVLPWQRGSDGMSELEWLAAVSRAFKDSPLVAAIALPQQRQDAAAARDSAGETAATDG